MKKLDEIPKKNIFELPDGYFDRLPLQIQARLETPAQTSSVSVWNLALRYALPSVIAVFALVYFFRPKSYEPEELLAGIASEHLIAYLNDSDISESDLLEAAHFDEADADSLSLQLNNVLFGGSNPDSRQDEFESALENEL
jgi:hypothetical protein